MNKSTLRNTMLVSFCGCLFLFQTLGKNGFFATNVDFVVSHMVPNDESQLRDTLVSYKRLPRFGFDSIHANFVFLSFLQYFGDEQVRKKTGYGLSPYFFESIIEDDPYYKDFYIFLTNSVSLNAAQPERSATLMEKGLARLENNRLDDSFFIWRYKAVDELLFLDDAESAEHSFRKAAEWAADSNHPEGEMLAYISQQTADFIEQNPDSKAAQIGAWGSVLSTAIDDETRNRAVEAIEALGGELVTGEDGRVTIQYSQVES